MQQRGLLVNNRGLIKGQLGVVSESSLSIALVSVITFFLLSDCEKDGE